ncbi:pilus assembly protein, partial [Candidatus Micrarchaeota archaeon]|nr:pilus assembly protein [Candidatus Micrarchaeota archaeon]MBU1930869.1 pilus assembly protein [Candidatus Micrarchaeota archaeon]
MNQKGQTAVEYLITTSFLLLITGIIFAYGLFIYTDSVASSTARTAVSSIVNTINQVYALGPGTALFISVDIPQNIGDIKIESTSSHSALVFQLQTSGGLSDISETAKTTFEFSGPTENDLKQEGRYPLKV